MVGAACAGERQQSDPYEPTNATGSRSPDNQGDRERHVAGDTMSGKDFLSERGKIALARHQRDVTTQLKQLHAVDRVLSGALSACDATTQAETFESYLETVQELRVSLQRLEGFLLQKLIQPRAVGVPETAHHASANGGPDTSGILPSD